MSISWFTWNHLKLLKISHKITWIALNIIFYFEKFWIIFCEYIKIENSNYKSENIEIKYSHNMPKTWFLELEKGFTELKDRKLKDREVKIKKEIEELFYLNWLLSL